MASNGLHLWARYLDKYIYTANHGQCSYSTNHNMSGQVPIVTRNTASFYLTSNDYRNSKFSWLHGGLPKLSILSTKFIYSPGGHRFNLHKAFIISFISF